MTSKLTRINFNFLQLLPCCVKYLTQYFGLLGQKIIMPGDMSGLCKDTGWGEVVISLVDQYIALPFFCKSFPPLSLLQGLCACNISVRIGVFQGILFSARSQPHSLLTFSCSLTHHHKVGMAGFTNFYHMLTSTRFIQSAEFYSRVWRFNTACGPFDSPK